MSAQASAAERPRRWRARPDRWGRVEGAWVVDMGRWSRRSAAVHHSLQVEAQAHRRRPALVVGKFWRCLQGKAGGQRVARRRMEVCAVVSPDDSVRQYLNTGRSLEGVVPRWWCPAGQWWWVSPKGCGVQGARLAALKRMQDGRCCALHCDLGLGSVQCRVQSGVQSGVQFGDAQFVWPWSREGVWMLRAGGY